MIFVWVKKEHFLNILNLKRIALNENLRFGTLVALSIPVKLISKGGWARGSAIFILQH